MFVKPGIYDQECKTHQVIVGAVASLCRMIHTTPAIAQVVSIVTFQVRGVAYTQYIVSDVIVIVVDTDNHIDDHTFVSALVSSI